MNDITVFLLCHNREKYSIMSIESILAQTCSNFNFIVSDNSSNNSLHEIIKDRYSNVEYISQSGGKLESFFEHFNKIKSIVKTEYVVMFHDDDIMLPNFIERMYDEIQLNKDAIAIAANGIPIDENDDYIRGEENLCVISDTNTKKFSSKKEILKQYLALDFGGAAPFCSYVYNTKKIKDINMDYNRGRKYCDTIFLMDIVEFGEIIWINQPLVKVRVHDKHISSSCGVLDYKSFLHVLKMDGGYGVDSKYIEEYRFRNLFSVLKRKNKYPLPSLKYLLYNFFKVMLYSASLRNLVVLKCFNHLKSFKKK